jgi:hypothetical protein
VGPHLLQSKIHSSFSADSAVWESLKSDVISTVAELNPQHIYYGHILREFNRKVITFGFNDLTFSPYDSGFRYSGDTITASTGPEAAYVAALTAAGATVTAPQQAALSAFISGEIAAGRWDGIKRLYFPVWGVAAANAICMKSLTSCTFNGAFTHASGYIQGGPNKYISLGANLSTLGLSVGSHYFAGLFKTAPSDNYKNILTADLSVGYGEESLRVAFSGTTCVDDNSYSPSDVFGIVSYGSQTTLASRYCKVRKASGVTSSSVQGGTISGNFGVTSVLMLGTASSSFWDGQCGALVLGTYMSDADDLLFTTALKNVWESTTELTLP